MEHTIEALLASSEADGKPRRDTANFGEDGGRRGTANFGSNRNPEATNILNDFDNIEAAPQDHGQSDEESGEEEDEDEYG